MKDDFKILTAKDKQYLLSRGISRYILFRFDMAVDIATKEGFIKLSSLGDRFAIFFEKEQVPLLRTIAWRHGIKFWNYTDYGMEKT